MSGKLSAAFKSLKQHTRLSPGVMTASCGFHMGVCFFDVAVPGGWYKGYESQVWFGVWLGGMIRGMARAPLNSCFVALDTAKLPCAG